MVRLTIDHKEIEVPGGTSVMDAALANGIFIPSMCYQKGFTNHPSCMVCLVRDDTRNDLVPSCAMPVEEGMNILSDTPEVREARRDAIELLLSDHAGDCEAPCRLSCPAFMDIPLMNRLIASGDFAAALRVVREEIPLPLVLGYICPAPCEKACKRKPLGGPVSICLLKRSAAIKGMKSGVEPPVPAPSNGKRVAIVGAGPAGLSAAHYLLLSGHDCILYDLQEKPGGTLRYGIPSGRLPESALDADIGVIRKLGAVIQTGTHITGDMLKKTILQDFHAVILATGIPDNTSLTTNLPGVFACGSSIDEHRMAVRSVAGGKMAALNVSAFLGTSDAALLQGHRHRSESVTGHMSVPELEEYLKESIPGNRIQPARGIAGGFTVKEAMQEAGRCLRCDCRKPAGCKLRYYAREYGAARRRFPGAERKQISRMLQHEQVVFETGKCIRCGLCVEIAGRRGESLGLTFIGRGFDVEIAVPFGETIREGLVAAAAECAAACPTGALALKNHEERHKK